MEFADENWPVGDYLNDHCWRWIWLTSTLQTVTWTLVIPLLGWVKSLLSDNTHQSWMPARFESVLNFYTIAGINFKLAFRRALFFAEPSTRRPLRDKANRRREPARTSQCRTISAKRSLWNTSEVNGDSPSLHFIIFRKAKHSQHTPYCF